MKKRPRIGDRVIIPFGRPENEIEVEVFRIRGEGEDAWVTVALFPDSPYEAERRREGDYTLTMCRLRDIRRAA